MSDEPVIAQKSPLAVDVTEGNDYYWCTCGKARVQPFCDGAHRGTSLTPMKYTAKRSETIYFCGCKKTKTSPVCDGSHSSL